MQNFEKKNDVQDESSNKTWMSYTGPSKIRILDLPPGLVKEEKFGKECGNVIYKALLENVRLPVFNSV